MAGPRALHCSLLLLALASPLALVDDAPAPRPAEPSRAVAHLDAPGTALYHESFALRYAHAGLEGASLGPNCIELRSERGTIHALGGSVTARWTPLPVGFESMELVVAPLDQAPSRGWSNRVLWRAIDAMELREDAPIRVFLQPTAGTGPGAQPFELEIGLEITGGVVEARPSSCRLP